MKTTPGCLALALSLTLSTTTIRAALNVVATTPDLGAIAESIGGDRVSITVLTKPTEDPHFVDAKPSFMVKLNRADALIEGGADLELGWLPPLLRGARNAKLALNSPGRILASEGVQLLEVPSALDRSQGDIHAKGNPHFMTDPINAKIVARHICESFCQIDDAGCDAYRANLETFSRQIDEKLKEWEQLLAPYRGNRVVAYHNTWPYFGRRFGLNIDLFLEPKPGIPPTPSHLAGVIRDMKADSIRAILVEPYQGRRTAERVATATDAAVLDMTQYPGGVSGTEAGYVKLIDYLVKTLAKGLAAEGG